MGVATIGNLYCGKFKLSNVTASNIMRADIREFGPIAEKSGIKATEQSLSLLSFLNLHNIQLLHISVKF